MNRERAAMLLSFKAENEILTKRQIMERAFVRNTYMFQSILDARYIAVLPWRPGDPPREYVLTEHGRIHRELAAEGPG